MNWNQELLASSLWLARAYGITLLAFGLFAWAVTRYTQWGRQFVALAGPYFSPRRSLKPLGILALILLLTLLAVRLNVLFSTWFNGMYTALQNLDAKVFWMEIAVFSVLASLHVVRSLFDFYIQQSFTLHWRQWQNEHLLGRWLDRQAYYRSQYLAQPADNPDQRLQQDVASFVTTSLDLSMGMVNALVSTVAYTLILWNLSGILNVLGLHIPRGMVFAVFLYVIVATGFAFRIGRPLVGLNFRNERLNADYRYALVRLREYAESIAFYGGEGVEGRQLRQRFARIIDNAWQIVYRSLKFQSFNFIVSQTAAVFPFIIQASRFFAKQITLGDMVQTAQAFGTLHDNLSFFRNAYDNFASYRAVLNRLSGFTEAISNAVALPEPSRHERGSELSLEGLSVRTPAGVLLLEQLTVRVDTARPLLIRGRSGAGKTTLLRAIAGLWPYSEGEIVRPEGASLFLSQKPYLPQGTLRDALYYPAGVVAQDDAMARQVLRDVQLGHLIDRLDESTDWGHILSLGEQQRLAFGRLLLARPQAAFLDEATSAMDEGLEEAMYRLVRERLPQLVLVSVGHRSTLRAFHPRELQLLGDGAWQLA
ncbi:ABC transporter ATP-binding protein/permease [Paludibacterium yongneupense]|uniref:ABC transporter ATP-binding protein/permease n=1 Tax=Paludibacterium yongneupense TaxID=400061 RepID=UPI000408CCB8|nr:ABC transporter ATP-binding protein/permease [Paludibacterium yongneupense]